MKMQQIGVIFSVAFIGASGEILALRGKVQDRRVVEVVRSVSPESEQEMQRKVLDIVDVVGNVSKQMAEFESKVNAKRRGLRDEKLRQEANRVLNIVDIVKYAKDKVQEQQSEHVLNIVDVVRFANGSHGDDDRADDVAKAQDLVVKVMIDADQSIEKIVSAFENLNSSLPGESKQIEANIIENMISDFHMAIVKHNDFTQAASLEFNGSQDPELVSLKQDLYEKIQNNVHKMFLMIQAAQSNQAEAKEANGQEEDSDKTYEISGSRSKPWNTPVDVSHEGDMVKPKSIDLVKGLGYMEQHLQALLKDAKKSYASLALAAEKAEQIKLKSRIATDLKRATKVHNEATGSYNQIIQTSSSQEQKAIAEKSYNNIDQMLKEIDNILLDLKKQAEDKTYEISGPRSKSLNKPVDVSHEGEMVKPVDVDEQSAKLLAQLQGADSDVKNILAHVQESDTALMSAKGKSEISLKQSIVQDYTKAKGIYESAIEIYKEIIKDGLKTSAKEEQEGLATEIYHGIGQSLEDMHNILPVVENESGVLDQNTAHQQMQDFMKGGAVKKNGMGFKKGPQSSKSKPVNVHQID